MLVLKIETRSELIEDESRFPHNPSSLTLLFSLPEEPL
jgi:hypothetical protein